MYSSNQPVTVTETIKTTTITGGPITHPPRGGLTQELKQKFAPLGTITFRPIEGKFYHDNDIIGKMDPYCKFKIGWRSGKSSVAKSQGTHPIWSGDAITIKVKDQQFAKLKVKDSDKLRLDNRLGVAQIPLALVIQRGKVTQWIPVAKKGITTGEILVEMYFTPHVTV